MCCTGEQDQCLCPVGCPCKCGDACPNCGGEDLDVAIKALIVDEEHDEELRSLTDAGISDETLRDLAGNDQTDE